MSPYREPITVGGTVNPDELVYGDDGNVVTISGVGTPFGFFTYLLENAVMTTDLECAFASLRNVGRFIPIPDPLIGTDDPRLSDARNMLPGSVTDASVALDAGIVQGKLNLNGLIPPAWMVAPPDENVVTGSPGNPVEVVTGDDALAVTIGGIAHADVVIVGDPLGAPNVPVTGDDGSVVTAGDQPNLLAARGDRVQFLSQKGVANGYAPLDSAGHVPLSMIPSVVGTGTVNSFGLNSAPAFLATVPPLVTSGSATMATDWLPIPAGSFFGNLLRVTGSPLFSTAPLDRLMIPGLDASKVVSGVFPTSQLPVAVGAGPSHSQGILPDPGATGAPEDYLARDMSYKTMRPAPSYEPMAPEPSITILDFTNGEALVAFTDSLPGASLFYRINHIGAFVPIPIDRPLPVARGSIVTAYAAKIGYSNSNIVALTIPQS